MALGKHKVPSIAPKTRAAIAALLHQTQYDLHSAALSAGLTTQRLRDELHKPHIRKFMRDERHAQLIGICQSNPEALARLRDHGTNQNAVVNSVKTLEEMLRHEQDEAGRQGAKVMPGLVLVIGSDVNTNVRIESKLAGARRVEDVAYQRGPDGDGDVIELHAEDEPTP